jgi:hypothetical protein
MVQTTPPKKLLKMPGRKPGTKSDINVRFLTERDYLELRQAAKSYHVTANLFITQTALWAARNPLVAKGALTAFSRSIGPKPAKQRA